MEGQVPNITDEEVGKVKTKWHTRRGRLCILPAMNSQASHAIKSLRHASFAVYGPRLFNILPDYIRNTTECVTDTFKRKLDKYLQTIPDEPQVSGYTSMRRADSNSLLDMHQHATARLVETLEESEDMSDAIGGHPWSP